MSKTSFAEVFVQFQIQVKRQEIQDYKQEMCQLEDRKQRLMKLQEQLKEEQYGHVCELRRQMKEQERNLEKKELGNKEQVELGVQENLKLKHKQENELKELHCMLARLQVEKDELQEERRVWLQFKNKDNAENQQMIQKLETHIAASERTYKEMSEYFQRSLILANEDTDRMTSQRSDEIIQLSEKTAKENLDCESKKELKDNEWLKKEVDNYFKKISVLESTAQKLEMDNLKHVNKLLNHPSHEHQTRKTLGSSDMHGISEAMMQISRVTSSEMVDIPSCSLQPSEEAEGVQQERDMTPATPPGLREILTGAIHLDSLKQKLLCVVGEAVPLHQPPSEPTDESEEMDPGTSKRKQSVLTLETIQKKLQQLHTSSGESDES